MSLIRRISNLLLRSKIDREIDAELRSHIEMRTEDNVAAGMSREEARHDAMIRFGNKSATKERAAGMDMALMLDSVWSDVRFALRQLARNPGFALTAILVLALGMGASIAISAFVDAALIKPLPYRGPSRLAAVFESMTLGARYHISYLDFVDWKRMNQVFSSLDVYESPSMTLTTRSGVQQVDGALVSEGFFRTLGVEPAMGRDFTQAEELPTSPQTVLLSFEAWQRRYGGNTDVLGKTVALGGQTHTIVGVLPRGFHFAPVGFADFWVPLRKSDSDGCMKERGCHNFSGVARLRDGVTIEAAGADMKRIADQLALQFPDADAKRGATVLPLSELIVGDLRPILILLLTGASLLLLIACVNVASLLLVRSESRKREIAVRGALGASRARLIRQLITEGSVLTAAAATLGLGAAALTVHMLLNLIPHGMMASMPYLRGLGMNARVAAFGCVVAIMTGLLLSFVPAMRLSRSGAGTGMRDALAAGGRSFAGTLWRRFGANLVVVELAMATVLLVCAGLLAESFYRLLHTDIGLKPEHLAALRITAPDASYPNDAQLAALNRKVVDRIASLPGTQSVGTCGQLPVGNAGGSVTFHVVGRPEHGERIEVLNRTVDERFFSAIGARMLRGRSFTASDDSSHPPVMIINKAMATVHFPGEDPIGKQIKYDSTSQAILIVGIVDDIQEGPLDSLAGPAMYTPFAQGPLGRFFIVVRSSMASSQAMLESMTAAIKQIDPNIATSQPTVMTERIHDSPAAYLHRASAWLVGGFAGVALLLGVVGLYGVIAYSVSQRTREIGVRMALGAKRASIYRLILREAGWLTGFGILAGLACSIAAGTMMRSLLFGTQAWDAPTLAAVSVVLGIFAMLASYFPARRAASVNPVEALRTE